MAVGAIGLKEVAEHIDGRIVVLGTPAEEGGGGESSHARGRIFWWYRLCSDDASLCKQYDIRGGLANRSINIEYFGKSVPLHIKK